MRVIVLGGGYGGILTAKKLEKKLRKYTKKHPDTKVEITLIDQKPFHTMLTELHEVAAGRVSESSIRLELSKIFYGRKVELVLDRIHTMDFDHNRLIGDKGEYSYDFLVMGTGSKPAFFGTQGAEENAFTLWSYEDAVKLHSHIEAAFLKASCESDLQIRQKLLTFCVVGAGFTGVEMAGELAEWVPALCKRYSIAKEDVTILNMDMIQRIIPSLPEKGSARAQKRLEKMGVRVMLETSVVEVGKDFVKTQKGGKTLELGTHTVIWTAGIEGSEVAASADLSHQGRGRVVTNSYLQAEGRPNVYVVGDNIFYKTADGQVVPQMVENAEASAHTAAVNVFHDITGTPDQKEEYNPKFHGMMVSIGGRYGTAYVGTTKKKFLLPSLLAMFSKHLINLVYFIQVMGLSKVYAYAQHEFFNIQDRRSFVGGHFSKNAPNFWSLPLRLFLAWMWLQEFLGKWPKFIEDPSRLFLISIPGMDAASGATDAVSSASQAAAEVIEALPVPQILSSIMDWGMGIFTVLPGLAPVVQGAMIIAELLLALALAAGLFTIPASVASAAMCVLIYMTGMASYELRWYFVASIALIGGGGTQFSLDYYVMPYLKSWWNRRKFVKKWYLFFD